MGVVKNTFPSVSLYNRIPFIQDNEHAAEEYKDKLNFLKSLLDKHDMPPAVCVKLIHIHFHLAEGEILAFSEFSAPPHGQIPFLGPVRPQSAPATKLYGCHYLVDDMGDLQAFEYTTMKGDIDLASYPAFAAEFSTAVAQRGMQDKFGLAIKSGAAMQGSWIELDYPAKRATFLLPSHISLPQSDSLVQRSTKTQFLSPKNEGIKKADSHSHTEHYERHAAEENAARPINGVSTENGLFLTGIPLDAGTPFYSVVSAMAVMAGA